MIARNTAVSLIPLLLIGHAWAQIPPPAAPATTSAPPAVELPAVAMPAAPATMLPPAEVMAPAPANGSLPAVPAPQAPANTVTEVPDDAAIAIPDQSKYSYGDASYSLLFTPTQVSNMKQALRAYEGMQRMGGNQPASTDLQVTQEEEFVAPQAEIVEPNPYPVFHLSSLVYNSPRDWTVWLDNKLITPLKNEGDVKVVGVSSEKVSFAWTPEYISALIQRADHNLFAPVKSLKNKLTSANTSSIDRTANVVLFTLKPNQTFSAGHMQTFEGKVPAPQLDKLVIAPPAQEAAPEGASGTGDANNVPAATTPLDPDKARMEDVLHNNQLMQGLSPPASVKPAP